MKTLVIIPSRMSATRLPGKPLLKINGKSIISHVFKRAESAEIGEVVVETEDIEIVNDILRNLKGYQYLILNIPMKYQNNKWNIDENIVKQFPKHSKFILNRTYDYGPITKLIPTIEFIQQNIHNNNYNLLIFDDNQYHMEAFKIIAEIQDKQHDKSFTYWKYKYENIDIPQGVDIISFWMPNLNHIIPFYQKYKHNKYCQHVDDLIIAKYLDNMGIPIKQIKRKWKWPWKYDNGNNNKFSLFAIKGNYSRDNCMKHCYSVIK